VKKEGLHNIWSVTPESIIQEILFDFKKSAGISLQSIILPDIFEGVILVFELGGV